MKNSGEIDMIKEELKQGTSTFNGKLLKEKEYQILDFLFYWGKPILPRDIANKLNLPHSTLNSVLHRLVGEDLIAWKKYGAVTLKGSGLELAKHLSNHHFIIEFFLKKTLDLSDEEAHYQALHLAGRVQCTLIDAICEKFNLPKSDNYTKFCVSRKYSQ